MIGNSFFLEILFGNVNERILESMKFGVIVVIVIVLDRDI